jgi:hypothetical protein
VPGAADLAALVRNELARPAPPYALRLSEAIRAEVGPAAAALLFYGSCLRKRTAEGVLDFYLLVDDYAAALPRSRALAWASRALPPSVFYVECPGEGETLRAKYALLSLRDFAKGAAPGGFRTGIFARFCQPALAVWLRDEGAREAVVAACVQAILTAAGTFAPLVPAPATSESFWHTAFAETYAAELRAERPAAVRALYDAAPDRYAQALRAALAELSARGRFGLQWKGERFSVLASDRERARARHAWRRRRRAAKAVYVAQLVKTAFTFGDWLPYVLWKLERQSGVHLPYSERQRRHPFVFGWPILWRALRTRALR